MTKKTGVLAIVQARIGSKRLPGKTLEHIGQKTMLGWVVQRLSESQLIDKIVIATSTNSLDDAVELFAKNEGLSVFRGSEQDVLGRFAETLKKHPAENIIRATGDNPLLDTTALDMMIKTHVQKEVDHTSLAGQVPLGIAAEVISFEALMKAHKNATAENFREHVTTFIHSQPEKFRIEQVMAPSYLAGRGERLTVDTADDMRLMRTIHTNLQHAGRDFNAKNALYLLAKQPELAKINRDVQQKDWKAQ